VIGQRENFAFVLLPYAQGAAEHCLQSHQLRVGYAIERSKPDRHDPLYHSGGGVVRSVTPPPTSPARRGRVVRWRRHKPRAIGSGWGGAEVCGVVDGERFFVRIGGRVWVAPADVPEFTRCTARTKRGKRCGNRWTTGR
jgi:hypothetical protein